MMPNYRIYFEVDTENVIDQNEAVKIARDVQDALAVRAAYNLHSPARAVNITPLNNKSHRPNLSTDEHGRVIVYDESGNEIGRQG